MEDVLTVEDVFDGRYLTITLNTLGGIKIRLNQRHSDKLGHFYIRFLDLIISPEIVKNKCEIEQLNKNIDVLREKARKDQIAVSKRMVKDKKTGHQEHPIDRQEMDALNYFGGKIHLLQDMVKLTLEKCGDAEKYYKEINKQKKDQERALKKSKANKDDVGYTG